MSDIIDVFLDILKFIGNIFLILLPWWVWLILVILIIIILVIYFYVIKPATENN
jgi:hypothetical protein